MVEKGYNLILGYFKASAESSDRTLVLTGGVFLYHAAGLH